MTKQVHVYRAHSVDGFEWVQPIDERDFDRVYQLDGSPRAASWTPIRVRMLERLDAHGRPLRRADLPWLGGHTLVLRDRPYEAVRDVLAAAGEFLELDLVDGERLWLFNVCRVVDALDEDRSSVVRFPSTGGVMTIERHGFRANIVRGQVAFRVPQVTTVFFTSSFVDVIRPHRFTGTTFTSVWEAEVP